MIARAWFGVGLLLTVQTLPLYGWQVEVVAVESDRCEPDTTGRTALYEATIALAPGLQVARDPVGRRVALRAAEIIRGFYVSPASVSLPLWARYIIESEKEESDVEAAWFGLSTELSFRLRPDGRLSDDRIEVRSSVPELNEALRRAILEADSAGALGATMSGIQAKERRVELRMVRREGKRGVAVPLPSVQVPIIKADRGPTIEKHPGLRFPPREALKRIPGVVELQFVIGVEGRADPTSFYVILVDPVDRMTFVRAAKSSVVKSVYRPARLGACPVPMLVWQRFFFRVEGE